MSDDRDVEMLLALIGKLVDGYHDDTNPSCTWPEPSDDVAWDHCYAHQMLDDLPARLVKRAVA